MSLTIGTAGFAPAPPPSSLPSAVQTLFEPPPPQPPAAVAATAKQEDTSQSKGDSGRNAEANDQRRGKLVDKLA